MDRGSTVCQWCLHEGVLVAEAGLGRKDCQVDTLLLLYKANVGFVVVLLSTLQVFLSLRLVTGEV